MRHAGLPRSLGYGAFLLVLTFAGLTMLAGSDGLGRANEDRFSNRAGERPARFTVFLQLEQAGIQGYFAEVSGLGSENDVVEYRDGGNPDVVHKLPGTLKWKNIVLKRGITSDASLWQWRRLVETGNLADARTNGKLTLLDRGRPIATWQFVSAWPAKISGPELNAEGTDIALEELVIVHEGMMRDD